MSLLIINKRGISLIEVIVAMLLVSVGVISLLSIQPSAWRYSARSDYLGRAAGILSQELQTKQAIIMNPCQTIPASDAAPRSIHVSGEAGEIAGDATFRVQTTIVNITPNLVWRVTVTVTWPPLNNTGITENILVTRQDKYRFPAGCL
ncbi:hypothetical protein A2V61_01920 [Candidatus Woesebacteria bacterium RBG_19FT_COMBO_47_8]|nr:MAG: hypothetical protein A2V61_01920 [Candidatus Woesebacteria bacterium RBG_19FT_COMBO_47_8]